MSDTTKTKEPFGGFYLKLAEAQREYEQEQQIDPASMTEEDRQNKIKEILEYLHDSRKKAKEDGALVAPIVPEEDPETAGTEAEQPTKLYMTDLIGDAYIAFKEGEVQHVYFVAETKGVDLLDGLELCGVEQAKIACAKAHFAAISNQSVVYDVVDSFDKLMQIVT